MIRPPSRPISIALRWLIVILWAALILWLLQLPGEKTPRVTFIPIADKLAHAIVFGIWAFLICWAFDRSLRLLSPAGVSVTAVLAVAAYGISSELYQSQIGRDAEVLDVVADLLGAIIACHVYFSPRWKALLKRLLARPAEDNTLLSPALPSSPLDVDPEPEGTQMH